VTVLCVLRMRGSSAFVTLHLLRRVLSTKTSTWLMVYKQPCHLHAAKWMSQGLIRSSMPLQLLSTEAHYTGHTFGQDASSFCRTPWDIRPWQSNRRSQSRTFDTMYMDPKGTPSPADKEIWHWSVSPLQILRDNHFFKICCNLEINLDI
jgi:hypothetical protein